MKITCKNGEILEGTYQELAQYQLMKMRQQQPANHSYLVIIPDEIAGNIDEVNKVLAQMVAKGLYS